MGPLAHRRLLARFPNIASRAFWTLLDFILPPDCVSCRQSGDIFCQDCRTTVHYIKSPLCQQCGYPLPASGTRQCSACRGAGVGLDRLRSAAFHVGALRHAIHSFKYKRNRALLQRLGGIMVRVWPADIPGNAVLLPVPLSSRRYRERGFNQATLLARYVSREVDLPLKPGALKRVRETQPQVGLNAVERQQNMAGAFQADARHIQGRPVILIDDVCTTGSTLSACASALRAGGAPEVWGVTLARAGGFQPQI